MKLTQAQIQFIDTYLQNSEIEFIDVRMEMIDHIASDIEHKMETEHTEFYYAFKNYMVLHKKEHQKANKRYKKATDVKTLQQLGYQFIKPSNLFILIGTFCFVKILSNYYDIGLFVRFAPITVLFLVCIYYFIISYTKGKKVRYSSLERLGLFLITLFQIVQISYNPFTQSITSNSSINLMTGFFAIIATTALIFLQLILKYNKEYTSLYKNTIV
ncbi:hypothetical protein [Cellulophaga sp. Z1A5H]|uniref:hypothetical protein n=1 Tax=Cellulophaga sp. Z1A5H TaxID=2687291 RepID=UPI0013FD61BD|nr:hypothetical protein [Cellulophaga sp. Z1A5H]